MNTSRLHRPSSVEDSRCIQIEDQNWKTHKEENDSCYQFEPHGCPRSLPVSVDQRYLTNLAGHSDSY